MIIEISSRLYGVHRTRFKKYAHNISKELLALSWGERQVGEVGGSAVFPDFIKPKRN